MEWSLGQIVWQGRLRTTGNESERVPNCPNHDCAKSGSNKVKLTFHFILLLHQLSEAQILYEDSARFRDRDQVTA